MDKKLERELQEKLKSEEQKNRFHEQNENKYVDGVNIFFGTLGPLYILFFVVYKIFMIYFGAAFSLLGVNFTWILPLIHGVIWRLSVFSVYKKRSMLDEIVQRL